MSDCRQSGGSTHFLKDRFGFRGSRELRDSIPFVFVCSFEEMTVATCHIHVSVFCEQSRVCLLSIHVSDCSCAIVGDQCLTMFDNETQNALIMRHIQRSIAPQTHDWY